MITQEQIQKCFEWAGGHFGTKGGLPPADLNSFEKWFLSLVNIQVQRDSIEHTRVWVRRVWVRRMWVRHHLTEGYAIADTLNEACWSALWDLVSKEEKSK